MAPFILTAIKATSESAPSIKVYTRNNKTLLATLGGEGTIAFNPAIDYEPEEVKAISQLQEHFFTLYNSIIEKDEEIRELKIEAERFKNPLNYNPVIDRQTIEGAKIKHPPLVKLKKK